LGVVALASICRTVIIIHTCLPGVGAVRIIACIEHAEVTEKILAHLDAKKRLSPKLRGGRRAGRRHSGGCSTKPNYPMTTARGFDANGAAAVADGQRVGVMGKSARAHPAGVDSGTVTPLRADW
jgi:hypothetical protein